MRNWALVNTTSILISRRPQLPHQTKISGKRRALEAAQGSFWGSQVALPGGVSPRGALKAPARLVLSAPWAVSTALLCCHTDLLIC